MRQAQATLVLRAIYRELRRLGVDPDTRIVEIAPDGGVKVTPIDSTSASSLLHRSAAEDRLDAVEKRLKAKANAREAARRPQTDRPAV